MNNLIYNSIQDQYNRIFIFIDRAINDSNLDSWNFRSHNQMSVWQHTIHLIDSLMFYTSRLQINENIYKNPFEIDFEDKNNPNPPKPEDVRTYFESCKEKLKLLLNENKDKFLTGEKNCPWVGKLYLDRIIYVIRHTTHHIGEINQILIQNNCKPIIQDR
jgi:uncharacterized damage-inducible protein DinB